MDKRGLIVCLITALFFSGLFLGCASVPQETLDEKEAMIQNLNGQIENLKQEVKSLQDLKDELASEKATLEGRLAETERMNKELESSSPVSWRMALSCARHSLSGTIPPIGIKPKWPMIRGLLFVRLN